VIATLIGAALLQGAVFESPRRNFTSGDPAPDTVLIAPAGSMQDRWAWAERTVRGRYDTFWVGWTVPGDPTGAQWYYIDRGVPVRVGTSVVTGTFQTSGSVGGLRFEGEPMASVVGQRDMHETTILLRYEMAGGTATLTRLHVGSFAFPVHFDGGALMWLGAGDDAGSVDLVRGAYADTDEDWAKRDLVSAVATHRTAAVASPVLRDWLADVSAPAAARRTAADGLAAIGDPDAVSALRSAARNDTSASVRSGAARALARSADAGTAIAELTRIAREDPDRGVRRTAVTSIGSIPDQSAFDALVAIIEAPPDTAASATRRTALTTVVAQSRQPSSPASQSVLDLLDRVARTDTDAAVRRQAISSLASLRDPRVTPLLARLAATHADDATRRAATTALSNAEPRAVALATLRNLAWEHESVDTQRAAVTALTRMQGDDVRTLLAELAENHPRADVRRSSLRAVLDMDTRATGGA
jgi:HEAT repeat protein